jgi:hypothetical protein
VAILVDDVIRPESLRGELLAFGLQAPLPPGTHIVPYLPEPMPNADVTAPVLTGGVVLSRNVWFFWVDDLPRAEHAHPTRFVFIDAQTGRVTVTDEEWWPVVNGSSLWASDAEYYDPALWVWSQLDAPLLPPAPSPIPPAPTMSPLPPPDPSSALVVNGWKPGERNGHFATNASTMAGVYNQMGLTTTTMGHNTSPAASPKAVLDWIKQKAKELKPCQDLFIYITGHGYNNFTSGIMVNGKTLSATRLRDVLRQVAPGVHVYLQVQSCHSGAFTSQASQAKAVEGADSSCNGAEKSYDDSDPPEDPNPSDTGSEHTSGFAEDYKKILDDAKKLDEVKKRAARLGISWRGLLFRLAKKSALEKDADAIRGRTHPSNWLRDKRKAVNDAVEELSALLASGAPTGKTKDHLEKAGKHLRDASDESLWADDERPTGEGGGRVLQSGLHAVHELEAAAAEDAGLWNEITVLKDLLVINLMAVAENAVIDAEDVVPLDLWNQHGLQSARRRVADLVTHGTRQLAENAEQERPGQFKALEQYRAAWQHASAALDMAAEPPGAAPLPFSWEEVVTLRDEARLLLLEARLLRVNDPEVEEANALIDEAGRALQRGLREMDKGHLQKAWSDFEEAAALAVEAGGLLF